MTEITIRDGLNKSVLFRELKIGDYFRCSTVTYLKTEKAKVPDFNVTSVDIETGILHHISDECKVYKIGKVEINIS